MLDEEVLRLFVEDGIAYFCLKIDRCSQEGEEIVEGVSEDDYSSVGSVDISRSDIIRAAMNGKQFTIVIGGITHGLMHFVESV